MSVQTSSSVDENAPRVLGRGTLWDYVFFARPVLLPPVWTVAILGANAAPFYTLGMAPWRTLLLLFHLGTLFGAVYTLNQIFDVESDRLNRKLHFLPEGLIAVSRAWRFTILLDAFAVAAAIGLAVTARGSMPGIWLFGLTLAIVALGILYSAPPWPWKNSAVLGLLANCVAHGGIVYWLGVSFSGEPVFAHTTPAIAYSLAVAGVYLATTVADIQGDRETDKRTFAVICGPAITMALATLLIAGAGGIAIWSKEYLLGISAALSFPFFLGALISRNPARAPLAAKAAVGILTLVAIWVWPWYLLLLIAGFAGTRRFFRWRFGIAYPTLW